MKKGGDGVTTLDSRTIETNVKKKVGGRFLEGMEIGKREDNYVKKHRKKFQCSMNLFQEEEVSHGTQWISF